MSSPDLEFDKGSAKAGGSGGVTVGVTTSNGASNTLLKTNATGQVADATGVTQATGKQIVITSQSATDIPLTVKGAGSQSGALQEWTDSTPTVLSRITKDGWMALGNNASSATPQLYSISDSTSGIIINGNTYIGFVTGGGLLQAVNSAGNSYEFGNGGKIDWSTGGALSGATDTRLSRIAANVVGVSNGTTSANLGFLQQNGRKRVANNATNATNTMSNLADLTINVAAGRKYSGSFVFVAKNSTGAEGLQFDMNGGGATWTSVQFIFKYLPIGATIGVRSSAAIGTAITATAVDTNDAVYEVYFTGVCNAGGTLIPRFAENSAHVSGTATVEAGSDCAIDDNP